MNARSIGTLALFVFGCLAVGFLGSLATAPAIPGWYADLQRPTWGPPNWLFAPVWTTLYVLIGVSGWRLFRASASPQRTVAGRWWLAQILLNAMWSPVFFGLKLPGVALAVIVAMWVAIAGSIVHAARVDRPAAGLLVPYLLWVSFATALNAAIVALN